MSQSGTAVGGTGAGLGNSPGTKDNPRARSPGLNVCLICNATFSTQDDYVQHVEREHPGTTDADAASASTPATGLRLQRE